MKKILSILWFFLFVGNLYAQSGNLNGKVSDSQTGGVVANAIISVANGHYTTKTDQNGEYNLLGIPAGRTDIHINCEGFRKLIVEDLRIYTDITVWQDFRLDRVSSESIPSEVKRGSPLLTNSLHVFTYDDIQHLPFRRIQDYVTLLPGTVYQDGDLHIHGGRRGEVGYFIEHSTAFNLFTNEANFRVIPEAVEEIQFHTGAYGAEYGGANSALVLTTMRTGGAEFEWTVDYRTDDFAQPGNQFLGTTSFGYRNAVVTAGGPVPVIPRLTFFIAAQHHYMANANRVLWSLSGLIV